MNEEYQILYQYLDELLRVQSNAAEMFEHSGVMGEVREKFLIQQILERIDSPMVSTGQVISNNRNAGQTDIIIRKRNTINPVVAGQTRITASDCSAVIEVKSTAVGTHFRDFNAKAQLIKAENPEIICGMFCYKLGLKKRNLLKRFGYNYDHEYLEFEMDSRLPLVYDHIDFVVCVDQEEESVFKRGTEYTYNKFFYLDKNQNPDSQYGLILSPPFSFYFLSQILMAHNSLV